MHPVPSKSALGKVKSKREIAEKEIEEWVLSDTDFARETSRHAGQLTENVTEERLLRARLMEMGKERCKILTKYSYEKQTFIEKQKRKFNTTKKNRAHSDKSSNSMCSSSHPILLKGDRSTDAQSTSVHRSYSPLLRPKTVQFEANMHEGGYISTGASDLRPNTVPINGRYPIQTSILQMEMPTPFGSYNDWSRPSTGVTGFSRSVSLASGTSFSMDSRRNCRFGSKFKGVTHDPRYAKLENSLSPNYVSHTKQNVKQIIEKIESLRKPTRTGNKDARRELEHKIKQFMEENRIVF